MNIVCIGGGPAGLYVSLLMKLRNPAHRIIVIERERADATFGWGVVLSDRMMAQLLCADAPSARAIGAAVKHWDTIAIDFKGSLTRTGGHRFCGIGRQRLLDILRARCTELGVELVFGQAVGDERAVAAEYGADLVIAADGVHSAIRARHAASYQPGIEQRLCRFVWLGVRKRFDAFTFAFRQTAHGWFQAHIYQYDGDSASFIVETPDSVWRAAGLDRMSAQQGVAFCERLFADLLDGQPLLAQPGHARGSASWLRFTRVACRHWVHWHGAVPVVLLGDAAHTAHYSIGSGTRLALEDALELAHCCGAAPAGALAAALADYQRVRMAEVSRLQDAAYNSMLWFENVASHATLEAPQFAYSLLTRSERVSHENLRLRDPQWIAGYEAWCAARAAAMHDEEDGTHVLYGK